MKMNSRMVNKSSPDGRFASERSRAQMGTVYRKRLSPDPARLALSIAGSLRAAGYAVTPEQVRAAMEAR